MIQISPSALCEGCEPAEDLFRLNRLRSQDEASTGLDATYRALGVTAEMRERLRQALLELAPIREQPMTDSIPAASVVSVS